MDIKIGDVVVINNSDINNESNYRSVSAINGNIVTVLYFVNDKLHETNCLYNELIKIK